MMQDFNETQEVLEAKPKNEYDNERQLKINELKIGLEQREADILKSLYTRKVI